MPGIGADIEEIRRFEKLEREKHGGFLKRIYTDTELSYCFSKHAPAQHLAARFCAKESVVKALGALGITGVSYSDIVIEKNGGAPVVRIASGSPAEDFEVALSMSHAGGHALAFALVQKR